jgi:hypothetical protein
MTQEEAFHHAGRGVCRKAAPPRIGSGASLADVEEVV